MREVPRGRRCGPWWQAAALAALLAPAAARADEPRTLRVPEEYTELRRALLAARAGDTVQLAAGRFDVGHLVVNRAVVLRGAGPGATVLVGDTSQDSLLYVSAGATLEGFGLASASGRGKHPLLVVLHDGPGRVVLRDLLLERSPAAGVTLYGGAVEVDGLEVRAPGRAGVEVQRALGDGGFVPWPRPTLRRVTVRDAGGAGVLLADGAGGLLEAPTITGSKGADVQVSGALTCTRLVGCGALRVAYDEGAIPFQPFLEARSWAQEAAERAELEGATAEAAAFAAARAAAADAVAGLTRLHREGLQSEDEGRHAAALAEYARGVFAAWARPGASTYPLDDALAYEVASFGRRHGPEALVRWLLTAPAPPAGGGYLRDLAEAERAAFTAAWLARRRADLAPLLAPLRAPPGPDLAAAARAQVAAIAAVHSARLPLEVPPLPEAAAAHDDVVAALEALLARDGGAAAGAALLDAAADPADGGSPARVALVRGLLGRQRLREAEAWRREAPRRAAQERAERVARRRARAARAEAEVAAAGADAARVVEAYRTCLLDLGAEAGDRTTRGEVAPTLVALAARLRSGQPPGVYADLYRALPEQLGPALTRDAVLLDPLPAAERLALLRLVHRDAPWRVGPYLPPLRVPGDHAGLQAAVDAAAPGQRIEVAAGDHPAPLRLRPHTHLVARGARLLHDHRPALVVEDCPGVRVTGLTLAPRQPRPAPGAAPAPGDAPEALVEVLRSEVELDIHVVDAHAVWAVRLVDSTGTVGGEVTGAARGGVSVSGPRSRVRVKGLALALPAGDLLAVRGGAEVDVEDLRVTTPGDGGGILLHGEGSRARVRDPRLLDLVRLAGGARPDAELTAALAERERARAQVVAAARAEYAALRGRWEPAGLAERFALLAEVEALARRLAEAGAPAGALGELGRREREELAAQARAQLEAWAKEPTDPFSTDARILRAGDDPRGVQRAVLVAVGRGELAAWSLQADAEAADRAANGGAPPAALAVHERLRADPGVFAAYQARVVALAKAQAAAARARGYGVEAKVWERSAPDLAAGTIGYSTLLGDLLTVRDLGEEPLRHRFALWRMVQRLVEDPLDEPARRALVLPIWEPADVERARGAVTRADLRSELFQDDLAAQRLRDALRAALTDDAARRAALPRLNDLLGRRCDPVLLIWRSALRSVDAAAADAPENLREVAAQEAVEDLRLAAALCDLVEPDTAALARAWLAFDRLPAAARTAADQEYAALAARSGFRSLTRPFLVAAPPSFALHRAWRALAGRHDLARRELALLEAWWRDDLGGCYRVGDPDQVPREEALVRAAFLLEQDPNSLQGLLLEALACQDERQRLEKLGRVIAAHPLDEDARLRRAGVLLRAGDRQGIIDAAVARGLKTKDIAWSFAKQFVDRIEAGIGPPPRVFEAYAALGEAAKKEGRFVDAAFAYYRAHEYLITTPALARGQGDVRLRGSLLVNAVQYLDLASAHALTIEVANQALSLGLDDELAQAARGRVVRAHKALKDPASAVAVCRASLREQPDDRAFMAELALSGGDAGDRAAVDEAAAHVARLAPRDPDAHYWVGRGYQALGALDEATAAYERARAAGPTAERRTHIHQGLGDVLRARAVALPARVGAEVRGRLPPLAGDGPAVEVRLTVIGHDDKAGSNDDRYRLGPEYEHVATYSRADRQLELHHRGQDWRYPVAQAAIEGFEVGARAAAFVVGEGLRQKRLVVAGKRGPDALLSWDADQGIRFDAAGERAAIVGARQEGGLAGKVVAVDDAVGARFDEVHLPWFTPDGWVHFARRGKAAFAVTPRGEEALDPFAFGVCADGRGRRRAVFTRILGVMPEVSWTGGASQTYARLAAWGPSGRDFAQVYALAVASDDTLRLAVDGQERRLAGWAPAFPLEKPTVLASEDGRRFLVRTSKEGPAQLFHDDRRVHAFGKDQAVYHETISADGASVAFSTQTPDARQVLVTDLRADRAPGAEYPLRRHDAMPGHDPRRIEVLRLVLSPRGGHVAWLAFDRQVSKLFLDGELVAQAGQGEGSFPSRWLCFTGDGRLVYLHRTGHGDALRLAGGAEYPLPTNLKHLDAVVVVGERSLRMVWLLRPERAAPRWRRVFVQAELTLPPP